MRALLDHQLTVQDLILIVSLFLNLLGLIAIVVVCNMRYDEWKWREWRSSSGRREDIRNPVYGIKRKS